MKNSLNWKKKTWDVNELWLWNVHFSVQKDKKEEGGVLTQLSYFFNGKHNIIKIMSPLPLSLFSMLCKKKKITSAFPANDTRAEVIDPPVIAIQLI